MYTDGAKMSRQNKTFSFHVGFDLWSEEYYERLIMSSKKRLEKHSSINTYRHTFVEDVIGQAFPIQFSSRDYKIELENKDELLMRIFAGSRNYYSDKNDVCEFLRSKLNELFLYSRIGLEVIVKNDIVRLSAFPANSLRYSFLRGKYYQKLPSNINQYSAYCLTPSDIPNNLSKTYFNKDDFFILHTPSILLKILPKFAQRSNILDLRDLAGIVTECANSNIEFKWGYERKLLQYAMFSDVCHRLDMHDDITEYYYLYRSLQMAWFAAKVREEMVDQINLLLKNICKKIKRPDNKFIITGLTSSDEYLEIMNKLYKNQISFDEVINKIFNKKD